MTDKWDSEANEICSAIGFNVGRSMIATALRMAYREGCRDIGRADAAHIQAQREKISALEERDAALKAIAGVWYFINCEAFEDWKFDFAKVIEAAKTRYGAND